MGAAGGKSKLLQKCPDLLCLIVVMEGLCHGTVAGTVLKREKVWHHHLDCTYQKASLDYTPFLHPFKLCPMRRLQDSRAWYRTGTKHI